MKNIGLSTDIKTNLNLGFALQSIAIAIWIKIKLLWALKIRQSFSIDEFEDMIFDYGYKLRVIGFTEKSGTKEYSKGTTRIFIKYDS